MLRQKALQLAGGLLRTAVQEKAYSAVARSLEHAKAMEQKSESDWTVGSSQIVVLSDEVIVERFQTYEPDLLRRPAPDVAIKQAELLWKSIEMASEPALWSALQEEL